MAIQWFPGHMHTTRLALVQRLKSGIDVVVELLDARLPGASANPLLATLTAARPALKVLNKQDLADPARTALWLDHYNAQPATRAIGLDASEPAPAARLIAACRAAPSSRLVAPKKIFSLRGKEVRADMGRVPFWKILFDTPGMLWPRITVPQSGLHLAASGAIGRNAYDEQEVALALLERLQASYPAALAGRYKLPDPVALAALQADALLGLIARQRGLVRSKGRLDLQEAADAVAHHTGNARGACGLGGRRRSAGRGAAGQEGAPGGVSSQATTARPYSAPRQPGAPQRQASRPSWCVSP